MALKIVYSIIVLEMIGMGLLMPALPPQLISLGSSNMVVGLVGSTFALLQLITNPVAGSLSDVEGRKAVLVKALTLSIISSITLGILSSSILGIFVARILYGFSSQTMVLSKALISDIVPEGEQTAAYGKMGALCALGFIIGPMIGGILLDFPNGFYLITAVLVILSIINLGLALNLPDDSGNKEKKAKKTENTTVLNKAYSELSKTFLNLKLVNWEIFWDLFVLKVLLESAAMMFHSSFGPYMMLNFQLSQKQFGYTLALYALSGVVFSILTEHIKSKFYSDDVSGKKRTYHGLLVMAVSLLTIPMSNSYWAFLTILVVLSSVRPLIDSAATELLLQRTTKDDKGVIMGSYESLMSVAGLIVPLLSGIIIDLWGISSAILCATLPIFASLYVTTKMKESKPEHLKR